MNRRAGRPSTPAPPKIDHLKWRCCDACGLTNQLHQFSIFPPRRLSSSSCMSVVRSSGMCCAVTAPRGHCRRAANKFGGKAKTSGRVATPLYKSTNCAVLLVQHGWYWMCVCMRTVRDFYQHFTLSVVVNYAMPIGMGCSRITRITRVFWAWIKPEMRECVSFPIDTYFDCWDDFIFRFRCDLD